MHQVSDVALQNHLLALDNLLNFNVRILIHASLQFREEKIVARFSTLMSFFS